jgi:hypothetical protein
MVKTSLHWTKAVQSDSIREKTMLRYFTPLVFVLFFSGAALAEETGINLGPALGGSTSMKVVKTDNYYGSCGEAAVMVFGVNRYTGGLFKVESDGARIVIRADGGRWLAIPSNEVFSDFNGMSCVESSSGPRLVIWSDCGGSACGQGFSFYIYDPEKLTKLAPREKDKAGCDKECATEVLGQKLPQQVLDHYR